MIEKNTGVVLELPVLEIFLAIQKLAPVRKKNT
jgi:hypothetical protein